MGALAFVHDLCFRAQFAAPKHIAYSSAPAYGLKYFQVSLREPSAPASRIQSAAQHVSSLLK